MKTASDRPISDLAGVPRRSLFLKAIQAREFGPLLGCVLAITVFQVGSHGDFLTGLQIANVATVGAALAIIGSAVTLLIIAGEFDLSVGTVFAIAPVTAGLLINNHGFGELPAFAIALVVSAFIGVINGVLAVKAKIPSFIVTLGMFYALEGLAIVMTGGLEFAIPTVGMANLLGGDIGSSTLSFLTVWALLIAFASWIVLERTRWGNWIFASGNQKGVARALGVPTARVKFVLFVACSLLSGFAGLCVASRLGTVGSTYGQDYNLLAIVAVVVGGTSLYGSSGTIVGTVIGAILVSSLQPGLLMIGAGGTWYQAVIGVILIAAVLFDIRFKSFREKYVGRRNAS